MFYVVLLVLIALLVRSLAGQGLHKALALGWAAALVLPVYMYREVGPLRIDYVTAVMLFSFACVMVHPSWRMPRRIVVVDVLMLALIGVITYSRLEGYGWKPAIFITTFLEWGAPYIFGRILFADRRTISAIASISVWVCLVLSVWAICESVTRYNFMLHLAGSYSVWESGEAFRMGLKRSEGPTLHPIFFGMLLALLIPWSLYAASKSYKNQGPFWWRWVPWLNFVGVFTTLSRGPLMGMALAVYIAACIHWKAWRGKLIMAGVLSAMLLIGYRTFLVDAIYAWSGETEARNIVQIRGKTYNYTGTSHRWLQYLVFQDAMYEAGLTGFGKMAPIAEAPHRQYVEKELRDTFFSIDNQYIFMVLSSGLIGLICFVLIGFATSYYLAQLARRDPEEDGLLAAGMCGIMLASMLMMFTVYFAMDFGFLWISMAGMAATWRASPYAQTATAPDYYLEDAMERQRGNVIRRLSPGHPMAHEA